MPDEEFKREVEALNEMLENLRLIKDKGRKKWLIREIKAAIIKLTKN